MNSKCLFIIGLYFSCFTSLPLHAHGDKGHPKVSIHTFQNGETWTSCSFQLHSSLTQGQFHRFAREAGSAIYFQPLSGASSLGKFKFEIALSLNASPIDQTSGAWNNTFAHPVTDLIEEDPHWLGDVITIPNLRLRMGVTDNIEVGTYITKDPNGNYGFWAADMKYTYQSVNKINFAGRSSFTKLFGPSDLNFYTASLDALISRKWLIFEPYAGISASLNHAKEVSEVVDLSNENVITPRGLAGVRIQYKWISASAEYDVSSLNTFSFKVGATF